MNLWPVSDAEYFLDRVAVSASMIEDWLRGPRYFHGRHVEFDIQGSHPTPAMTLGTLVHQLVLQPHLPVAVMPKFDRRTKAGKEGYEAFLIANNGTLAASAEQYDTAQRAVKAVHGNHLAFRLIELCLHQEKPIRWDDAATGLPCTAKPDAFGDYAIIDLKVTIDPSPEGFNRSIAKFGYHRRACHYLAAFPEGTRYIFVTVGGEPPHDVFTHELSGEWLHFGDEERNAALAGIAKARQTNAYDDPRQAVLHVAECPKWYTMKEFQQYE